MLLIDVIDAGLAISLEEVACWDIQLVIFIGQTWRQQLPFELQPVTPMIQSCSTVEVTTGVVRRTTACSVVTWWLVVGLPDARCMCLY